MGSKRKNSSGSKACTQSAERVAEHDIELKVSEAMAPGEEKNTPQDVCTPEFPASQTTVAPESASAPASSVEEGNVSAPESQPVEQPEAGFAPTPEPAPRNISLHASAIPLSIKPEMSVDWPLSRKRQVFNVFYFGLIALQLLGIGQSGIIDNRLFLQFLYFSAGGCAFLMFASLIYLGNHRLHQTPSDELSPRVRRSLRAVGLLIPALLMMGFMRYEPRDVETAYVPPTVPTAFDSVAFNAEMSQGKRDFRHRRFNEARTHFENAAVMNPQSDSAFEWVANANDSMHDPTAAITAGLRAVLLNPENENAHVILSHSYNMAGNFDLGLDYAQRAAALNPEDGEAYGNMSTSFNGLGQPDKALIADNSHVKYHNYEAQAFDQRARTLERLGRTNEARFDRQLAENIRWGRGGVPH